MKRMIISSENFQILNTLPAEKCSYCILSNTHNGYGNIKCPLDGISKRIGYSKNHNGKLFVCDCDLKTTKLFKDAFTSITNSLKELIDTSEEIKEHSIPNISTRVNRVVHNLKSINAHAIQELYSLIPQEQLIKNDLKKNTTYVESLIKKDSKKAAITFLRMAKFNLSVKAEFSIYEKLLHGTYQITKRHHNIRDVIMTVLYTFYGDFHDKGIYVDVEDYYEKVPLDFESFQVAIYHIIENAAKYMAPKSNATITFKIEHNLQLVTFSMTSLYIQPIEESAIFAEGYSGYFAKVTKLAGKGIGMFRAQQLIKLHKGTLSIEAGEKSMSKNNIDYAYNKFIISLPLD